MVAIGAETIRKIKLAQNVVEPHIINMIMNSDQARCPYRLLMAGQAETDETKEIVTNIARMLYKNDLLTGLDISLSDEESFDTILYAFGYWGGKTLYKHGNEICRCENKCY
ncbi:MAG: hypothetical protein V3U20_06430 [Thermoplasmata archaeon]